MYRQTIKAVYYYYNNNYYYIDNLQDRPRYEGVLKYCKICTNSRNI